MKFYGQFNNPRVDEYLYEEFFKNTLNGTAIECGAYDGKLECSCRFFEEQLGWNVINVEPEPNAFRLLQINRTNSYLNINKALVPKNLAGSKVEFTSVSLPELAITGLGSISTTEYANNLTPQQRKKATYTSYLVNTTSYSDLIQLTGIFSLDLLVLDVEGYELPILKDLSQKDILPKVFCIETSKDRIETINSILFPLGYKFHSYTHVNAHYTRN